MYYGSSGIINNNSERRKYPNRFRLCLTLLSRGQW